MEHPSPALHQRFLPALARLREGLERFPYEKWRWVWVPVVIFLSTRLLIFVTAYLGNVLLASTPPFRYVDFGPDPPILGLLSKWDSEWYLLIASKGYYFNGSQVSPVVFFPLYPALMRAFNVVLNNFYLSGYLISNASLLGGLILLYRLAEEIYADPATARRAVLYLCIFPSAVFFSAIYSESLFFFLAIGCVYFARSHRWWLCALFGVPLTASRMLGVLVLLWVLWEWLLAMGWSWRRPLALPSWQTFRRQAAGLAAMLLIPAGLLAYVAYLWRTFGDPLAFLTAEQGFRNHLVGIWNVLRTYGDVIHNQPNSPVLMMYTLGLVLLVALLAALPLIARRLGLGAVLFCFGVAAIHSSTTLGALPRYLLPLFPFCLVLAGAAARRPWLDQALRVTFAMLLAVFTITFTNFGYFF
jgi:hypothetical protein